MGNRPTNLKVVKCGWVIKNLQIITNFSNHRKVLSRKPLHANQLAQSTRHKANRKLDIKQIGKCPHLLLYLKAHWVNVNSATVINV